MAWTLSPDVRLVLLHAHYSFAAPRLPVPHASQHSRISCFLSRQLGAHAVDTRAPPFRWEDQALSTIPSNIMLAHLTRAEIKESNIAVLGRPEFEANHQAKGDMRDPIWEGIDEAGGAKTWRIEQSRLIDWPDQGRVSA